MPSTEVTHHTSSRVGQLAIGFAVVIAVVLSWWLLAGRHQAVPFTVEGYATPSNAGTAIGLSSKPGGAQEGYVIAGAMWTEGGVWHEGSELPTCVGDDPNVTTRVRMGVIRLQSDPSPANTVVWIECLST